MKYAIIIPDGAADDPIESLGNKTPLEAARKPFMDEIARTGILGTARTVPDGFESGSDVATMSLLGYDPAKYHTGRAPLEAAAQRIKLSPSDWVFRCNLVTTIDGVMIDHSAGGISDDEARILLTSLADKMKGIRAPWSRGGQLVGLMDDFEFHPGVSYRNLLVYRGNEHFDLKTKPPHEIPNEKFEPYLPSGIGQDILRKIITRSQQLFAVHPVNVARRAKGQREATTVWLWGEGHSPSMPTFEQRFGVKNGAMITGVDLLRGLANLLGWTCLDVKGITSFHDTDYAGQGRATADALDRFDIVLSHIESPDEASHQADIKTKIAAIEAIDEHVVGPVLKKLRTFDEWRILVLPDHPTNIATRKHGYSPTLWAVTGSDVHPIGLKNYSEREAKSGKMFENGHDLMPWFLSKKIV